MAAMEGQQSGAPGQGEIEWLRHWSRETVWFRRYLPTDLPWGKESLLDPVPEKVAGVIDVATSNAAHLAKVLEEQPYPAPKG